MMVMGWGSGAQPRRFHGVRGGAPRRKIFNGFMHFKHIFIDFPPWTSTGGRDRACMMLLLMPRLSKQQ